jgi:catechol 2,3-dioxygenase-like lactoylglutathione lyase family enzyme
MRPNNTLGLRHVALYVKQLAACEHFYSTLLGMEVVWRPDPDNIYLSSGSDNLALHRAPVDFVAGKYQHLDHLGFFLKEKADVDQWHDFLIKEKVIIKAAPKDHRDGTRSFYCADPDENIVQMIWVPGLSRQPGLL